MAAKSKQSFNYVAHVQRDGKVTEIAGTREDYSMKKVYSFLLQLASSMGGWLLAEQITEDGSASESSPSKAVSLYVQADDPTPETPTFGDKATWVKYDHRYAGASQLTFKENDDE